MHDLVRRLVELFDLLHHTTLGSNAKPALNFPQERIDQPHLNSSLRQELH